jgi:Tol biopolymer transport system component
VLSDLAARISLQVRMFSVADDGTLAFIPRVQRPDVASLAWIDVDGHETPIVEIDRVADTPRLSRDGTRIAFRAPAPDCHVWVHDLRRGTTAPVTREGDNHGLVWWPGDRRIAFARAASGAKWGVVSARADGAGELEHYGDAVIQHAWLSDISHDNKWLLVGGQAQGTNSNIELLSVEDGTVRTLLGTRFRERGATFSPDGSHIAYVSNESGRQQVYVQPFPGLDTRTQVSTDGGTEPLWSRDGSKLYFRKGNALWAAAVQTDPTFAAGRPGELLRGDFTAGPRGVAGYDVSPDGKRFAVFRANVGKGQVEVKLVFNWFEELRALEAASGS